MRTSHLDNPRNDSILLTGATGFVGRFLLTQLLEDSDRTIYCLTRAHSEDDAALRIRDTLVRWDLWRPGYERHIAAIPGDLRKPRLGLREDHYQEILGHVSSIFNCGASVNHLESYDSAKTANVIGTSELLKMAGQGVPKAIHHISTLGVFAPQEHSGSRVVTEETSIEHERHRNSSGYAASKWVAEGLILKARDRGAPCNIFRLGLLWADSRHGRFDEQQHVYRLIKSCLLAGCGIENFRYDLDPLPVDYAARAIVTLAARHHGERQIFHIASSVQSPDGLFEQCNSLLDHPLQLLPYYDWIREVKRLHHAGRSLPMVPLLEYAFAMDRKEFTEYLHRNERSRVKTDCRRTCRELESLGICQPRLYPRLLAVCLDAMLARDGQLRDLRTARVA